MAVVVGYSPSGQGTAALRSAVREAQRARIPLVVASHQYHDAEKGISVASDAEVRAAIDEITPDPPELEVRLSGEGEDLGDFLLRTAADVGASVLVIGLRRKSPIGKLHLGASARKVLLGATCPVLTVKGEVRSASGAPRSAPSMAAALR